MTVPVIQSLIYTTPKADAEDLYWCLQITKTTNNGSNLPMSTNSHNSNSSDLCLLCVYPMLILEKEDLIRIPQEACELYIINSIC